MKFFDEPTEEDIAIREHAFRHPRRWEIHSRFEVFHIHFSRPPLQPKVKIIDRSLPRLAIEMPISYMIVKFGEVKKSKRIIRLLHKIGNVSITKNQPKEPTKNQPNEPTKIQPNEPTKIQPKELTLDQPPAYEQPPSFSVAITMPWNKTWYMWTNNDVCDILTM